MTIDLIILGVALLFALLGALTGAARQLANLAALAVAYLASRRLGPVVAPHLADAVGGPLLLGTLASTVLVFLGVMLVTRHVLTVLLRHLMGGGNTENRELDRALGFVLGGMKVLLIAYVVLSALVFVEQHVVVAGRRVGLSPRDSLAFGVARRFNLFEKTQFAPLRDLVQVAQAAADPDRARQLQRTPAYKALRQEPRFRRALADPKLRAALERGDYHALLRNDLILQLIQDPDTAARLGAAARATRKEEFTR